MDDCGSVKDEREKKRIFWGIYQSIAWIINIEIRRFSYSLLIFFECGTHSNSSPHSLSVECLPLVHILLAGFVCVTQFRLKQWQSKPAASQFSTKGVVRKWASNSIVNLKTVNNTQSTTRGGGEEEAVKCLETLKLFPIDRQRWKFNTISNTAMGSFKDSSWTYNQFSHQVDPVLSDSLDDRQSSSLPT